MTCSDLPTLHPFIQRSPTDLISTEIISIAFYCFCRRYPQSRGDRLLIYYSQYFFLNEWMNTLCFYSPYCHRFVSKLLSVAPTIHKTTAANGSKTQGFNIYWIWTNVLHAAHWSCSVMGKCRVLVSTQRHTVQSGSAGSAGSAGTRRQNEAAKRREGGKLLRGIFDPLALTKHHKYPSELATQQHAWGLYLLKLSDTHTPPKNGDTVARKAPISQPCPSLSVKEKSTYIHAPPTQWFSLGRAQTSKKETMRW